MPYEPNAADQEHGKGLFVFYDNWCPMCTRTMRFYRKWDWFKRITFMPAREEQILEQFQVDQEQALKRMVAVKYTKKKKYRMTANAAKHLETQQFEGIDTIYHMSRQIPILWVLVPFLYAARILGIGAYVYDWIASSRKIIPIGQCEGDVCMIPKR
ncbi:DUF393 domain-containing protein [Paenibacillus sp. HJL G12]|uniref:DUF393 domain-containing protein n=1 Tax=Paenibacillus dendrobii TaxID=2691084 RepID=A0A7X3IIJ7_9BACL|nr:DUF393 domain-containing protein [Paenibacillus dendrobii]MWV44126.1 DUF393 domain-containing protein [Paenibacillus dendrobii]